MPVDQPLLGKDEEPPGKALRPRRSLQFQDDVLVITSVRLPVAQGDVSIRS